MYSLILYDVLNLTLNSKDNSNLSHYKQHILINDVFYFLSVYLLVDSYPSN